MRLNFFGGESRGVSVNADPQECVNFYPEVNKQGGIHSLIGTPGLVELVDLSTTTASSTTNLSNGGFTGNADSWTLVTWAYSANTIVKAAGTAGTATQTATNLAVALVEDLTYRLAFTVSSYSAGVVVATIGGTAGTPVNANGTYSQDIVAGSGGTVVFTASAAFAGTLDGVTLYLLTTPNEEIRGTHIAGDYLYVVHGKKVLQITSAYASSTLNSSTPLYNKTGKVTMAHVNNSSGSEQIMICEGVDGVGYIYDTTTEDFTKITTAGHTFYGGGTVTSQDGYFISSRLNKNEFYISSLNDGLTWDVLDITTAEVKTSDISRVFSSYRELWIFKKDSTEIFYNTGADPVFQRISGGNIELGLEATDSVALVDNALFWLASDLTVRMARGYTPTIVSTPQVAERIRKFNTVSDAFGYGYTDRGHSFYVLTFPTEKTTLAYDVSTQLWHRRSSYIADGVADDGRHRSNSYVKFNGDHVVGDFENNKLYKFDNDTYADDGNRIIRKRVFKGINEERKRIFMHSFQMDFESGVGIVTGQGSSPKAMLEVSTNGGHSYRDILTADIGSIGDYDTRCIWHRLGEGRDIVMRVTISDPVKSVIVGAYLEAEMGTD